MPPKPAEGSSLKCHSYPDVLFRFTNNKILRYPSVSMLQAWDPKNYVQIETLHCPFKDSGEMVSGCPHGYTYSDPDECILGAIHRTKYASKWRVWAPGM